jgi:hypothetical protein
MARASGSMWLSRQSVLSAGRILCNQSHPSGQCQTVVPALCVAFKVVGDWQGPVCEGSLQVDHAKLDGCCPRWLELCCRPVQ